MGHNDFTELELALEHEEIPVILEFNDINTETTAFFLIYHKSHDEEITSICQAATKIEDFLDYLNEEGFDSHLLQEKINEAEKDI